MQLHSAVKARLRSENAAIAVNAVLEGKVGFGRRRSTSCFSDPGLNRCTLHDSGAVHGPARPCIAAVRAETHLR